jgi:AhpD family alkylhydroperoxidase
VASLVEIPDLITENTPVTLMEAGDNPDRQAPRRYKLAVVKLWTDEEVAADPRVEAIFNDIRATRKTDFVNHFWRALANQPAVLERTWTSVKQVMIEPGALDPLTKELIYIAVSATNSCSYCVHSHTAAARAKGLTPEQHAELLAVIGMAAETNAMATALQIPVDPEFEIR